MLSYLAGLNRDTSPLGKTKQRISELIPAASVESSDPSELSCLSLSPSLTKSLQPCACKEEIASASEEKLFIKAPYFCSDNIPTRTDGHSSPKQFLYVASKCCRARLVAGTLVLVLA